MTGTLSQFQTAKQLFQEKHNMDSEINDVVLELGNAIDKTQGMHTLGCLLDGMHPAAGYILPLQHC